MTAAFAASAATEPAMNDQMVSPRTAVVAAIARFNRRSLRFAASRR